MGPYFSEMPDSIIENEVKVKEEKPENNQKYVSKFVIDYLY